MINKGEFLEGPAMRSSGAATGTRSRMPARSISTTTGPRTRTTTSASADPRIECPGVSIADEGKTLGRNSPGEPSPKARHQANPGTVAGATAAAAEHGETIFSEDRIYRYTLWRSWGGLFDETGYAMFIGLNPSTADETNDDPTIRRCIAFAKAWGFTGLCMTNLFGFRATDPKVMMSFADPVGCDNDSHLLRVAEGAGIVIAAWGAHGTHLRRDEHVKALIPNLHYLRLTKDGHPGHPLYLPKDLTPISWGQS